MMASGWEGNASPSPHAFAAYGDPACLVERVAAYVRGPSFDPPPLPRVAQEVWRACALGGASALQVAKVVHRDPVVAGRIMALANSARFSVSESAALTLREAIVRIGFDELLNVVLTISLKSALYSLGFLGALGEQSRRHGLATALAASSLAEATGIAPSARAFLIGLLHDIGEPLVLHIVERVFQSEGRDVPGGESEARAAARALHAEVGGLVADRWQLDLGLRVAITKHHSERPLAESGPLLRLVRVADCLALMAVESLEAEPGARPASLPAGVPDFPIELLERVAAELPERLAEYDDL